MRAYQNLPSPMFAALKRDLEAVGVKPAETWEETKDRLALQARAQLSRKTLKPATVVKWHLVGFIANAGQTRPASRRA